MKPITIENVATFRRIQQAHEHLHIPEISQKRKMTDVAFLITFAVCILATLSLMVYSLTQSDMQRLIHGYDQCGNVCGSKNSPADINLMCSGQDMTDKPFLVYKRIYDTSHTDVIPIRCAESCSSYEYTIRFYRCFPFNNDDIAGVTFLSQVLENFQDEPVGLIVMCLVSLGLTIVALLAFRYFLNTFVWVMITIAILLILAVTGVFWYLYSSSGDSSRQAFLVCAIIFTVFSIFFLICILVIRSTIKLIIRFFEEAISIIFAMPLILLVPLLTFFSHFVVLAIFVYTFLLMATSGTLEVVRFASRTYEYVPDTAISVARYLSVIMVLWMLQFVLACQQMVISGAVSSYYFTWDKLTLVSPIYSSFYNLIRYHLGTTAFGSLFITAATIFRTMLQQMKQTRRLYIIYLCCSPLIDLLKYLTSMGYIETAIHGQALCRSSIRAVNLIVANFLSAVAMNSVGNLVFFMAKLVVVAATVGVGIAMQLSTVTLVLAGFVAFICIHSVLVVFEIAVDTIFLCYCEDQFMNDGLENPFYTTVDLYNYIKKAQILTVVQRKYKT